MKNNPGQVFTVFDYETYSEADLKKVGGWEYSLHKSTEILMVASRTGTRENLRKAKTHIWTPCLPLDSGGGFGFLLSALRNPEIQLVAHNASFEQMITRNVFAPKYMPSKLEELQNIPIERWHCTAAMSRSIGIPGNLEGAGAALKLPIQKDKEGHKLMLKLSKPRKPTKKDPSTRVTDPELIRKLALYCVRDVDTAVELFLNLPELHPKQRKFWILNQKINFRGFAVDRKLVKGALKLIARETINMDRRVNVLTKGKLNSARQRAAVLSFVKKSGIALPNLKAETVQGFLKNTKPKPGQETAFEVLKIRDMISRSSTAKYAAFEARSRSDGRARDNTVWFGAHTGRDAGTGLQPQNLPSLASPSMRNTGLKQADIEAGLDLIKAGDYHAIEALYNKPMELYALALRSCIVAPKGSTLEVGDFATIEVRVLFWLANELYGLKQIKEGIDLYCEMSGKIYDEDAIEILRRYKDGDKVAALMRQLGKQTVLGGGFGIGVGGEKFLATALQYGLDISLDIAQAAVRAYREMYPRVPIFWKNIEAAAIAAVRNPGKRYRLGFLVWQMEGNRLTCQLPSGRKLSYFNARVTQKQTMYGPKPTLEYMGVLSPSKIFGRIHTWGGKLTENCVQAIAADCLYESLLAIEEQGTRKPVLAVHDEIVSEKVKILDTGTAGAQWKLEGYTGLMGVVPSWGKGLPIKVEGWSEARYRK